MILPKSLLYITLSSEKVIKNSIHQSILQEIENDFDKIYLLCCGPHYQRKEGKYHILSGSFPLWLYHVRKIKKIISEVTLIIATDYFVGGYFATLFKRGKSCPLVVRVASPWVWEQDSLIAAIKTAVVKYTKRKVIQNSDLVIYNSQALIEKEIPHPYVVIYNGVDTKMFTPLPNFKKRKAGVQPTQRPLRLLYIGNINKEKGLSYLFQALSLLEKEHGHTDDQQKAELTIVGDGPFLEKYKQDFPHVNFIGRVAQKEVPFIIQNHDLLILPTLVESFPNVLLEAMACGKPVIASKIYGIPEMVTDGYDGFLVPPKDPEALARAIETFFRHPALLVKMGRNARQKVIESFKKSEHISKIKERIQQVLMDNRKGT